MDGVKERLKRSVQLRLAWSLSLAILLVALAAGVVALVSAFDEAHEFQDDMLQEVALLFDGRLGWPEGAAGASLAGSDSDTRFTVQRLADDGAAHAIVGQPLALSVALADGLHTLRLDDETYRVLVRTVDGGARIAVAQETDERDEIAQDSALRTLLPCLLLLPLVPLLVIYLVRKMFRPIATLAADLDGRAAAALHPVDPRELPVEVAPFAVSMNRLLARVAQSLTAQRRFVADAAHELRSPLAALSLQADRLADAEMSALAHERLARLKLGIVRARHLLEQLLMLAKVQSGAVQEQARAVSLRQTCLHVLEALLPLAEEKRIDIGIVDGEHGEAFGEQDAAIAMSEIDLATIIRNLVDNAIRYTPEHGRVDLALWRSGARAMLAVSDTGPGIPAAERERVFDPFYRVLGSAQDGSGLGLSIVRAIAERAGASVALDVAKGGGGLRVTLALPLGECAEGQS